MPRGSRLTCLPADRVNQAQRAGVWIAPMTASPHAVIAITGTLRNPVQLSLRVRVWGFAHFMTMGMLDLIPVGSMGPKAG